MKTQYGNEIGECGSHEICDCICHTNKDIRHVVGCCDRCPKCGENCLMLDRLERQRNHEAMWRSISGDSFEEIIG